MEYVDGENLASLLEREGALSIPRAVELVRQVCRGLRVAHAEHIVHRDLKPRNLIVCRRADGTDLVKIVDFGIAKLSGERRKLAASTTTGATLGTPHYMSPEQARGEKDVDSRSDIYAAGVILYELLTGHKPHTGDSYNAIIYHILSKEPIPIREHRPDVPAGLALVVHRAMSTDAGGRFSSALELDRALAPYAPAQPERLAPDAETLLSSPSVPGGERGVFGLRIALAFVAGAIVAVVLVALLRPSEHTPATPAAAADAKRPQPSAVVASSVERSATRPLGSSVEPDVTPPSASPANAPEAKVARQPASAPRKTRSAAAAPAASFDFSNPYE
jgi:serine/threonine-protein kinase